MGLNHTQIVAELGRWTGRGFPWGPPAIGHSQPVRCHSQITLSFATHQITDCYSLPSAHISLPALCRHLPVASYPVPFEPFLYCQMRVLLANGPTGCFMHTSRRRPPTLLCRTSLRAVSQPCQNGMPAITSSKATQLPKSHNTGIGRTSFNPRPCRQLQITDSYRAGALGWNFTRVHLLLGF